MKRNVTRLILAAVAAVTITAGCEKGLEYVADDTGSPIQFEASTEWLNDIETRTEYSGVDENGRAVSSSSNYERIDWIAGYDRIRVLCDAAVGKETASKKTADYIIHSVSVPSNDKKKSQAGISAGDDNTLQWGTGTHYFYALYPAPNMESKYGFTTNNPVTEANAKIETVTGNKAKITGVIPASQQAVKQGNNFKANMNYAYMYARAQGTPGSTSRVVLPFYPLVTTVEVRLKGISSDLISSKLTSLELSSATTALTGTFNATISATGNPTIATTGTTGKKVTITVPNGGTTLSATQAQTFTFLTLPVEQKDLTLTLNFADGTTRKLALKKNGSFITVAACKKAYFDNLGVPNSIYYLDVVGPTASIGPEGGSRAYTVKSYVNSDGGNSPVTWTAQFSTDDGATWSSDKPSWLTAFTTSDSGSLTDKRYTATASENNTYTNKVWKGSRTIVLGNNTSDTAIDLSLRDVKGNAISRSTANCYVVNSPGWYKIPLVYGNAIKNGQTNTIAYSNNNNATYALKNFVRHDGQPITNPWIKDNGITVTSAEMLWQDQQYLISLSVDSSPNPPFISSDYLYFYVNEGYIKQGNAVLAAKDASGTIVWSWHIWVLDDLTYLDTVSVTSPNSVVNPVKIAKVNLGWYDAMQVTVPRSVKVKVTQAGSGLTGEFVVFQMQQMPHGGNTYYQWGRKDPSLGATDNLEASHAQFAVSADNYFTVKPMQRVSIGESIKHPNHFYPNYEAYHTENCTICSDGLYYYGWCSSRYDNLWNANGKYDQDIAVVKTVYDPCPYGFKVPNMEAFSAFYGSYPASEWNFGIKFKNTATGGQEIFFPCTSLREAGTGVVRTWFYSCFASTATLSYHSASTSTETYMSSRYLQINQPSSDGHTPEEGAPVSIGLARTGGQSYGFPIRPIAD